jgi:osmotically-inducible protein OsmY
MLNRIHKTNRKLIATAIATATLTATAPAFAGQQAGDWEGELKDAWLDGKLETSYTLNRYLNPLDIETDVENGVVLLTGTVDSEIDRELAEEIAKGTKGVSEVVNELEVVKTDRSELAEDTESALDDFEQRFSDATTTARVKFALLANESTEGLDIDVDTRQGVVTLEGEVASDQAMELAERIAANAEGVNEVDNKLRVASSS